MRTGRHYVGYDTEAAYIDAARMRVADEVARVAAEDARGRSPFRTVELPAVPGPADPSEDFQARAVREGRKAKELALEVLKHCGFTDVRTDVRYPVLGVEVSFLARDATGADWAFDVSGGFTSSRAGLKRTDTLWKALGKAAVLHEARPAMPLVLLTTDAPAKGSPGDAALRVVLGPGKPICDVVELLSGEGQERLHRYATDGLPS